VTSFLPVNTKFGFMCSVFSPNSFFTLLEANYEKNYKLKSVDRRQAIRFHVEENVLSVEKIRQRQGKSFNWTLALLGNIPVDFTWKNNFCKLASFKK
jgi:hypothetical protein